MDIETLLAEPPIPEDNLREWLKAVHQIVPPSQRSPGTWTVKSLEKLIDSLLATSIEPGLPPRHRAAACNFACAIFDIARQSHDATTNAALSHTKAWKRLLDTFIERSDVSMTKSMRQVLLALSSYLRDRLNHCTESVELRDEALRAFLRIIFVDREHIKIKPALQGLTEFLSKSIISIPHLLQFFETLVLDRQPMRQGSSKPDEVLSQFLVKLFTWISHNDVALALGQLVSQALKQYSKDGTGYSPSRGLNDPPVWADPIVATVIRKPDSLENFRNTVFAKLFRESTRDFFNFLKSMRTFARIAPQLLTDNAMDTPHGGYGLGDAETELFFSALQTGKELGIVKDTDDISEIALREEIIVIPVKIISSLIVDQSPTIRLSAVSLCVSSPAVTLPFTVVTLRLLRSALPSLISESDAQFRGELLGHVQRLFDRLRGACAYLQKAINKSGSSVRSDLSGPTVQLNYHQAFVRWLSRFLLGEMHSSASYQNHFTAIRVLAMMVRSGLDPAVATENLAKQAQVDLKWPFAIKILTPWTLRSLQDLLMDPFDDVRQTAAVVLHMWPAESASTQALVNPMTRAYLSRAERLMLRTGRADQADGVARAYSVSFAAACAGGNLVTDSENTLGTDITIFTQLLDQLERGIAAATTGLPEAVRSYPLHGTLISLRYLLEQANFYHRLSSAPSDAVVRWKTLHQRIYASFPVIWTIVRPVLSNDAPEGYVLEDSDDVPDMTTKDVLSYCWRALKESSALQRIMITKTPSSAIQSTRFLDEDEFAALGDLCFTQLSDLRHRGAFSTVAQTFAACCTRSMTATEPRSQDLIHAWYARAIQSIEAKAAFLTRRSAGLPSLMTGIICADPDGPMLHEAMRTLFEIATTPNDDSLDRSVPLPQVHAMNCLRAIFIHSKLGLSSERYVLDGLGLAASSLRSSLWAIRNCGLMLFRALIDRMLGTYDSGNVSEESENKTARFSYSNYPTLMDIILRLLGAGDDQPELWDKGLASALQSPGALEAVFPALHLLQRVPPLKDQRSRFVQPVLKLTESSHWHVRDMAARTLVRLTSDLEFERIWDLAVPDHPHLQNSLHGFLLTLKHYIRARMSSRDGLIDELSDLKKAHTRLLARFDILFERNACPVTRAAYTELLSMTSASVINHGMTMSNSTKFLETNGSADTYNDELALVVAPSFLKQPVWFRKALATDVLLRLLYAGPYEDLELQVSEVLHSLAKSSPQVCCHAITRLQYYVLQQSNNGTTQICLLGKAICNLAQRQLEEEVRSGVYQSLAELSLHIKVDLSNVSISATSILDGSASPSLSEAMICIWGLSLSDKASVMGSWNSLTDELVALAQVLKSNLADPRTFSARMASVRSLKGLRHLWSSQESCLNRNVVLACLPIYLVTYDALNDDDDEIRDLASAVVTDVLTGQGFLRNCGVLIPMKAAQNLAAFLIRSYPRSTELCIEAIKRLCQPSFADFDRPRRVRDVIAKGFEEDNTLFVEEKQNLYIDEVREAALWSCVLKRMSPETLSRHVVASFTTWVVEGLDALIITAKGHQDGALGWTWKPEVFVVGLQVICAADVLMVWRLRTKRVPVPGSVFRRKLRELADAGQECGLHEMWLEKIERVLREAVPQRLTVLQEKLRVILMRIE
ncbi:hypothetical protein NA57DRAFT_74618 [Rhizodiscina lignyota]|uniref:DUF2428 domain-containing protein n=1 Tax=Rhizodiscina lignyota TaxID=1504668 RepID=A0A9P4IKQ2_9PEZI|nr:hypothetical protein NA57DRAFT_74618 [Rhizodiscina lignyota]